MVTTADPTSSDVQRGKPSFKIGTVVSDRGDKTITVRYEFTVKHPKYGKYCRRSGKLRTHDEKNKARVGDLVEIASCRPFSKTKTWRLKRIIKSAESVS